MSTKGEIRKQRQAEHAARQQAKQEAASHPQPKPRRPRTTRTRGAGYLGTWEAMDAFEAGRPMSSDDY